MKIVISAVLFFASLNLVCANNFDSIQNSVQQSADTMSDACVSIKSKSGSWGSGVLVSRSGLIFSAAHVFAANGEKVTVYYNDKKTATARVIGFDKESDLAVLKLEQKSHIAPAFIKREKVPGEPITLVAVGHASGFNPERRSPTRVGFGFTIPKAGKIYSTCRITIGDSGGPLYDEDGNLCAIHNTMDSKGQYGLHTPIARFFQLWPKLEQAVFQPNLATANINLQAVNS